MHTSFSTILQKDMAATNTFTNAISVSGGRLTLILPFTLLSCLEVTTLLWPWVVTLAKRCMGNQSVTLANQSVTLANRCMGNHQVTANRMGITEFVLA